MRARRAPAHHDLVDGGGGLALMIAVVAGGALLLPTILLGWLVWSIARRRGRSGAWAVLALPLGIAAGLYLAFFVILDDLGEDWLARRAAPAVQIVVPKEARGRQYVFFDASAPPLREAGPKRYVIEVPPSGKLVVGPFEQLERTFSHAEFEVVHPDGTKAQRAWGGGGGGRTQSVWYMTFFVGTDDEERADRAERDRTGRLFDEEQVFRELRAAGAR